MASEKEVTAIKDRVSFRLLDLPEVSGVGVEKDKDGFVLAVHLNTDEEAIRKRVLDEVKGGPVKFVVSGPFKKQ